MGREVEAEWRVTEESVAWQKPVLYKENGFKTKEDAAKLTTYIERVQPMEAEVTAIERKTEKKSHRPVARRQGSGLRAWRAAVPPLLGVTVRLLKPCMFFLARRPGMPRRFQARTFFHRF